MNRSYQLGMLVTGFVVAILVFFLFREGIFFYGGSSIKIRGTQTLNLSHAKQIATACKLYAVDHEGRFPVHFSELEPDYIPKGGLSRLRCQVGKNVDAPEFELDWLYFGAGFNDKDSLTLLIASPLTAVTSGKQTRVVIMPDTAGQIIPEEAYALLLANTVKEMEAMEEARRPKKPSSAPADKAVP